METEFISNLEFSPSIEGEYVNKEMLLSVINAGQVALELRNSGLTATIKTNKEDLVTEGDTKVTEILKEYLLKQFPEIIFIDEETASTHAIDINEPGLHVVIDPIDGTSKYYEGDENWGISVGFISDGLPQAGIIYQPGADKIFYAEKGKGAFVNNTKISVSTTQELENSTPYFDFPYPKDKVEHDLTTALLAASTQELHTKEPTKLGSQVIEIMKVAEGEADFFFMLKTKPWDVAAALSIVSEAGGQLKNIKGEPYKLFEENIVLTNGVIDLRKFFEVASNQKKANDFSLANG